MAYIDIEYYKSLYGDIDEMVFNRLVYNASKHIDYHTTGIDGIAKLKEAFPTDYDSAEAVMRCVAETIYTMYKIEQAENALSAENGRAIASMSAGGESISYVTGATIFEKVAGDKMEQEKLLNFVIVKMLTDVTDANGVRLLYMGEYPKGG